MSQLAEFGKRADLKFSPFKGYQFISDAVNFQFNQKAVFKTLF